MKPGGLYIQVPFCASKCSFCNFSSQVAPTDVYDGYVESLEREMILRGKWGGCKDSGAGLGLQTFDTVYVGGGTPTLLGIERLARVFRAIRVSFNLKDANEVTVEIAPGSTPGRMLDHLLALGVSRLSFGAQSFEDIELRTTGRLHTAGDTLAALRCARAGGFRNLSLDLIAGLPYQTTESWRRSLRTAASLEPEHISIYLFEADEKSRLGRQLLSGKGGGHAAFVPDEEFMAQAYEEACGFLPKEGYEHYEISNFARPGFESAHNLKYWRRDPYLGLGAGAHSFDGRVRWANDADPASYCARLNRGELPVADSRPLDVAAEMEEYFFLGLREIKGVSLEHARRMWRTPPLDVWKESARRLQEEGFLREQGGRLMLTERAYLVSNEVFEQFLC
ncbi:MAG: radical SAM family heme chaperone HemW [Acidobacteriota bacterium]|nr:radical SAM family heme chaperone HemW [Acidobacteriota bacterium]